MKERFIGALFAYALGDALGAPIAGLNFSKIQEEFGDKGIKKLSLHPLTHQAIVTAMTEEMLYTVDGILWAKALSMEPPLPVYRSYLRWLYERTGVLYARSDYLWLHRQEHEKHYFLPPRMKTIPERIGGETTELVLMSGFRGSEDHVVNDAAEADAIGRGLGIGLFYGRDLKKTYDYGKEIAAFTHGNLETIWSAGFYAVFIGALSRGNNLQTSFDLAYGFLPKEAGALGQLFLRAKDLGEQNASAGMHSFGSENSGKQALAMAIYSSFLKKDLKEALLCSVNQDGNSHEFGALTGGIMGAYFGNENTLPGWYYYVELHQTIQIWAERLYEAQNKSW